MQAQTQGLTSCNRLDTLPPMNKFVELYQGPLTPRQKWLDRHQQARRAARWLRWDLPPILFNQPRYKRRKRQRLKALTASESLRSSATN